MREGFGPGASGGVLGGLGRRHRCDVSAGERRCEVEQRHGLDVMGLEVRRGGGGAMRRAVVRVALGVHMYELFVGAGEARGGDLDVGDICAGTGTPISVPSRERDL